MVKNPPVYAGEAGLIPGSQRTPEGGHGNPLQYSCLENPMDRGAWQVTVHGAAKSWTRLSMHTHINFYKDVSWDSDRNCVESEDQFGK